MNRVNRAAALLLTLILNSTSTGLAQNASPVPATVPSRDQGARALLAAPLKTTGMTLEGPRKSTYQVRVQLPKGLEVKRDTDGSIGREAWIRPGKTAKFDLEMELGLWDDDGMVLSFGGTTVTTREGAFTVSTTTYADGDVNLRVVRPGGQAFAGVLTCTARVSGWGVSPALRVKTRALALKICKSFELVPR